MSWSKSFDVPIALPDGGELATLDDARRHLLALPNDRHGDADVTTAIDALMMAAGGRGPMMHARIGIARLVYGPPKIPEPMPSTQRPWGRRRLARDS